MATVDYGSDLSITDDLDPLLRFVSGTELMGQVCLRRLYARPGSLLSNPVDNTIDVRDFLATEITASDLPRIQGLCAGALLGDQRIFSATVVATYDTTSRTLTLAISCDGAGGPFNLTISVNSVTVSLLQP